MIDNFKNPRQEFDDDDYGKTVGIIENNWGKTKPKKRKSCIL